MTIYAIIGIEWQKDQKSYKLPTTPHAAISRVVFGARQRIALDISKDEKEKQLETSELIPY